MIRFLYWNIGREGQGDFISQFYLISVSPFFLLDTRAEQSKMDNKNLSFSDMTYYKKSSFSLQCSEMVSVTIGEAAFWRRFSTRRVCMAGAHPAFWPKQQCYPTNIASVNLVMVNPPFSPQRI